MSYKLHCPDCRTAIPPENINVQQTIASCPNCGAVFNFADNIPTGQKIKRRKTKKPDNMTVVETDNSLKLETPYLQTPGYKIWTGVGSLFMLGLYGLMLVGTLSDGEITPAVLFSVMFIPIILWSISTFFATQTIEVTDDELKHEIRWANIPFYQRKMLVGDVVDVEIAETATTSASTAEARYNIYADRYDGRQDMFIQNQPEQMAIYTQQALSNYINTDTTDTNRLIDQDTLHDEAIIVDDEQASQAQGL